MDATRLLPLQFLLSLTAWAILGAWLVAPWLSRKPREQAMMILVLPQAFRHIGATLLVPGMTSPSLPAAFSSPVVAGDLTTVALALLTLGALRLRPTLAPGAAWALSVFGLADLLLNLLRGMRMGVAPLLGPAWVVPAFIVPGMLVAHVLLMALLLGRLPGGRTVEGKRS